MSTTLVIAPVKKSITVAVPLARAFEVFTAGLDCWWPKSHGIGAAPITRSILEPFVGGPGIRCMQTGRTFRSAS